MAETKPTSLSREELQQFMQEKCPELASIDPKPPTPERRKIVVGLLAYGATMYCKTAMSLMQAIMGVASQGWAFAYILREGDSMVARGRNILVSTFLQAPDLQDATDLVLIDCDLEFSAADFVKICQAPVDVIGGAYPFKDMTGNFPLRWPADGLFEEDGLWKVAAVTPGFMRITRKALEKMRTEFAHLEFRDKALKGEQKAWMFFDNIQRTNGVWDEGYVFCERWRQCGGHVYLDPDLNLTHIGLHAYNHGTIRQWLDKKAHHFTHLESEYPHIPPLKLMSKVMGQKIDLEPANEPDGQHHHEVPAGTLEGDDPADAPEHQEERHDADGVGGRGRQADDPDALGPTSEYVQEVKRVRKAARGQPGGEVRPRPNGSASGHLPPSG